MTSRVTCHLPILCIHSKVLIQAQTTPPSFNQIPFQSFWERQQKKTQILGPLQQTPPPFQRPRWCSYVLGCWLHLAQPSDANIWGVNQKIQDSLSLLQNGALGEAFLFWHGRTGWKDTAFNKWTMTIHKAYCYSVLGFLSLQNYKAKTFLWLRNHAV